MATLQTLDRRLEVVARRLTRGIERTGKIIIEEIADRIVIRTPVLTGFARGNWRPSLNAPAPDPVTILDPTGQATIARIKAIAQTFRVGSTFFLVNRAERWHKWLLEHPEEFKTLRGLAEVEDNFKDGDSTDIVSSA